MINVKVNSEWKQLKPNFPLYDMPITEPVAYRTGAALYDEFEVPDGYHLWRETDDGHDHELIRYDDSALNLLTIWDDDRFYTALKEINGAD